MFTSSNTKKWLNLLWYGYPRLILNNSCHFYLAPIVAGVGLSTALPFYVFCFIIQHGSGSTIKKEVPKNNTTKLILLLTCVTAKAMHFCST